MRTQKTGWVCGFIALAMPLCVVAAGKTHGCAKVRDDADRLACYDAEFGKPERAAAVVAPPPATQAPAAKAPVAPPEAKPERSVVADAAAERPEPDSSREKFTAVVADAKVTPRGLYTVTLANGQVWRQLEFDNAVEIKAGDTITVRPAALGSFMLVTKAGVRTRVKLVQ